jgi:hypothetical protein
MTWSGSSIACRDICMLLVLFSCLSQVVSMVEPQIEQFQDDVTFNSTR